MDKLRTPLMATAIYLFLLGLSTITPSIASSVFQYEVKDAGLLLSLSSIFFGFGVVSWGIASNVDRFGGLAGHIMIALVIGVVFVAYGWLTGLYTVRNAIGPIVINIALIFWIWSARPKS